MLVGEIIPPEVKRILTTYKVIAVVGLSPKSDRPSYQVAQYLLSAGYTVIPVNPGQKVILGQTCYPDLSSIPVPVEVVDIFRRPADVEPVVDEAIRIGARVVWMQLGIINEQAARKAGEAGLQVVMDRCIKIDHMQITGRAGF